MLVGGSEQPSKLGNIGRSADVCTLKPCATAAVRAFL
jgi:hypothetical protein